MTIIVNNGNEPSRDYATPWVHTSAPTDYDILANGPGGSAGNGVCCRQLTITNATGDVVVRDPNGDLATLKLSTLLAEPVQIIAAQALVADGSSACTVMVKW